MHTSGEWISATLSMPVERETAQGFGSALSYCRRYALTAMLGIAAEDDDAEASKGTVAPAAKPTGAYVKPPQPQRKPDPRLTPEQNQQAAELFRSGR